MQLFVAIPPEDDGRGTQVSEQQIQWRLKKRRVHWIENTIILLVGLNRLNEGFSGAIGAQAVRQQFAGVRPPLAEIVVHINYGDIRVTRALLEACQARGDLQRVLENCLSVGKFEMIDDIHQKEYGWRSMANDFVSHTSGEAFQTRHPFFERQRRGSCSRHLYCFQPRHFMR